MTYQEKLKDPRWIAKSKEIKNRDNNECQECGFGKNLHVHHVIYIFRKEPWTYEDEYLITLCDKCHEYEHELKVRLKTKIDSMLLSGMSTKNIIDKIDVAF